VFTASPVTNVSSLETPPVTTSPVLTPIRTLTRAPTLRSSRPWIAFMLACISSAARQARSASSSCASGTPKAATTASPMNFSTLPPWRWSAARISRKYERSSSCTASASTRSPRAVEPDMSQKTMVASLRLSGPGVASEAPQ
jgi:hypothetical protein